MPARVTSGLIKGFANQTAGAALVAMLSIAVADGVPPSEFRVFKAGANETTKGTFLFDEKSAASVMAAYEAHGAEVMVDYDHASLASLVVDPSLSGRAAAWCKLELRGGDLWAVSVRWTEAAFAQLAAKEWRYMSPAFCTDDSGRITEIINIAITNIPATHGLTPLVAASITASAGGPMSPELIKKIIDALAEGDLPDSAKALLTEVVTEATGAAETPAEEPAVEAAPEEMAGAPVVPDDEEKSATAVASQVRALTGKSTDHAALELVKVWHASHLKIEETSRKLAEDRKAIELGQRRANAVALIKLGSEYPFTAWAKDKTGAPIVGQLSERMLSESIEEQNARVAGILAAKGGKMPEDPKPGGAPAEPNTFALADGRTVTLSAREVAMCASKKIDPAKYAATRGNIRTNHNTETAK